MANAVYENKVIGDKFDSVLKTKVDVNAYLTIDTTLAENAGMKKVINTYTPVGNIEDLTMGNGNTGDIESSLVSHEYDVITSQGRAKYYDEQAMKDPNVVDVLVQGEAEKMVNHWTEKAITEMGKTTQTIACDFSSDDLFNKIADAAALIGEDMEGYTLLISPANVAYARKQLKSTLQYSEGFARTGYIGSICGFPIVMSKAVSDDCMLLVNKEAVTLFVKKDTEVEQERDADTRQNKMWIRRVGVVALTDARKAVVIGKAQSTACAITTYTKGAKTIAGTCGTDCHLVVVVDGDDLTYSVVPTAGAWTVTAKENLTAGDKINATAYAPGKAAKAATEVTVAS